jgi:hypothetical protein
VGAILCQPVYGFQATGKRYGQHRGRQQYTNSRQPPAFGAFDPGGRNDGDRPRHCPGSGDQRHDPGHYLVRDQEHHRSPGQGGQWL